MFLQLVGELCVVELEPASCGQGEDFDGFGEDVSLRGELDCF